MILKHFFFLLLFPHFLFAQNNGSKILLAYDKISLRTDEQLFSTYEDKSGNLWIATNDGIIRYNGYEKEEFNIQHGIADNLNFGFFEDKQNRLWLRSNNGKFCYYHNKKWYNEENDSLCKKFVSQSYISTIVEHGDKLLFSTQFHGIYILDKNGVEHIVSKEPKNAIERFDFLSDRQLIIQKRDGMYLYDLINKIEQKIFAFDEHWTYSTMAVYKHSVIFSYGRKIYKYENNTVAFLFAIPEHQIEIISLNPYDKEKYLVGTRKGFGVMNIKNLYYQAYYLDTRVSSISKSSYGGIWICTYSLGLFYAHSIQDLNLTYQDVGSVYIIKADRKGEIWIGNNTNYVYKLKDKKIIKAFDFNSLFSKNVRVEYFTDFLELPDSSMLIGNKVFLSRIKNDVIKENRREGVNEFVWDTIQQKIYVRYNSISSLNYNNGNLENTFIENLNTKSNAITMYENTLFVSVNKNVYILKNKKLTLFQEFNELIADLKQEYLLTRSGRLYKLENNQYRLLAFKSYPNVLYQEIKLYKNILFASSNKGLFIYDFKKMQVGRENRFKFLDIYSLEISDSNLYIGTSDGLYFLDMHDLHFENDKAMTSYQFISIVSGLRQYDLKNSSSISLPYKNRKSVLNFSITNFLEQPTIFYKIDQSEWTATKNAYIPLILESGHHEVYLYAELDEKPVINKAKKIIIKIEKAFWQKNWFRILCTLIFIFIMYFIVQYFKKRNEAKFEDERIEQNRLLHELQLQKEIVMLEQKALRMQMNPHFIFNVINTFKGLYADMNEKEGSRYINTFSKLLRKILENETFVNSIADELDIAESYLKLMKIKYPDFSYQINTNGLDIDRAFIPSLIMQPFVENAILHGISSTQGKGHVDINIQSIAKNRIQILVEDNGNGFIQTSKNHQSKSFDISKKRLEIFNEGGVYRLHLQHNEINNKTQLIIETKIKFL